MTKTYYCNLKGNKNKLEFLESQYKMVRVIARYYLYVIRKTKEYRKNEIHKLTYYKIRDHFPSLFAKSIQHTRDKVLSSVKDRKLFKIKKFTIPLIFDYQDFRVEFKKGYYSAWLRMCKRNYPLEGLYTINKIKNVVKIKEIHLKKININWIIYFVCEIEDKNLVSGTKRLGCDINLNNISLSDNHRYSLKRFLHKKKEYRKNKQKIKVSNYTKNTIHILTKNLVKYLVETGGSRIILEDLTNIRKSVSRKKETSKGKTLNYLINNSFPFAMFQSFLKYKCDEVGIKVDFVNPRNTSKTCSNCGSLNTERPVRSLLICNSCGLRINADFNGAKNIAIFSDNNGLPNESNHQEALETIPEKLQTVRLQ